MAVEVALLILTEIGSLGKRTVDHMLRTVSGQVSKRLYVGVANSAVTQVDSGRMFDLIAAIYSRAHCVCHQLDVRVLLDNLKATMSFSGGVYTKAKDSTLDTEYADGYHCGGCAGVVLGGTFDRLHNGHKILLSSAALLGRQQFTCGVTEGDMLKKKVLHDLIEPVDVRIAAVRDFVEDVSPSLSCKIVPIYDPFGPSIVDTNLDCIVASEETETGANAVNKRRNQNGLALLDVFTIALVHDADDECAKVASSDIRRQLLGTLLRPPLPKPFLPSRPYVIGVTGGIASGKTNICKELAKLGAEVIDCDHLGHLTYEPGTSVYNQVIDTFGVEVVHGERGTKIDRRVLGVKVFADKNELKKLDLIVWPAIAALVLERIGNSTSAIVAVDAAVLIEAGWDGMVNEVWAPIVPRDEAVRRIVERNKLTEEQACQRIDTQITNRERIAHANVILCSLWEYEVTAAQVQKAWNGLMKRIPPVSS